MQRQVKQKDRLFQFESPLGPDALLLNSFEGEEKLDSLFHFNLELVSEDPGIKWDQILGRNVSAGIRQRDGKSFRWFNGHVSSFAPVQHEGRLCYYVAEVVPWTWFLTQTRDCLYYQRKTIPEIIELTLQKYGFQPGDYQMKVKGDHRPWEYCCQYRESSYDFIARLMEAEGITFFYQHEKGKHVMVIVDDRTSFPPLPSHPRVAFEHNTGAGVYRDEDTIVTARMTKSVKPTRYTLKEYNYLIPKQALLCQAEARKKTRNDLEVYDYPGDFEYKPEGDQYSGYREQEEVSSRTQVDGTGNCRSLLPGHRFDLDGHPSDAMNRNFLVLGVRHSAHEGTFVAGSDAAEAYYENTFTAIPASVQYRPERNTGKPVMRGSQTAFVVGPKGEEIFTDNLGRVKVQFHWDRKGKRDEESSCWIRVMQPWAGMGYGQLWIPRIGQEVIVDFLEGDPDRPIITGCVYNEDNRPPYDLPSDRNSSGVKTRSTRNGTSENYNEIRLTDTIGSELFSMQAEKDLYIKVKNDTGENVDRDRFLTVKRNQTESVKGDKHTTVQGETRQDVGKDLSIHVGGSVSEKADRTIFIEAGGEIHIKAGGRIVLESGAGVTFLGSGGSSFLDVTAAGIVAQGPQVLLNCGMPTPGRATPSSPAAPALPGTVTAAPAGPQAKPASSSSGSSGVAAGPQLKSDSSSAASVGGPAGPEAKSDAGNGASVGGAAGPQPQPAAVNTGAVPAAPVEPPAPAPAPAAGGPLLSNPWVDASAYQSEGSSANIRKGPGNQPPAAPKPESGGSK